MYKQNTEPVEIVNPIESNTYLNFYTIPDTPYILINRDGVCIRVTDGFRFSTHLNFYGYYVFGYIFNSKKYILKIHRLLAKTFIGRPLRHLDKTFEQLQVNHINSIRTDNALSNLEWVTHKENIQHGFVNNPRNTFRAVLVKNIYTDEIIRYISIHACAAVFNLKEDTLQRHLSIKTTVKAINGRFVFKYDDGTPWGDYDFTKLKELGTIKIPISVTNLNNGEVINYDSVISAAKATSTWDVMIRRNLKFKDSYILRNFCYSYIKNVKEKNISS